MNIHVVSAFRRTVVALALMSAAATAQQAPSTLTVSGVVTGSDDTPLPRVRVAAANAASPEPAVLTDARGQFQLHVPDVASVRLTFSKAGYLSFALDAPTRVSNERDTGLRVRLVRAGAISGHVFDQRGSPLRVTVSARRAGAPATSTPLSTTTNDLGEYRFGGLSEGTYTVSARPPSDPVGGPDTRAADLTVMPVEAAPTNVRTGEESGNVNLTINVATSTSQRALNSAPRGDAATASISGRVVAHDGVPLPGVSVFTMQGVGGGGWVTETDASGRYRIDRLSAGEHTVRAIKNGYPSRTYGEVSLRAGQEAGSIDFTLSRGATIAGTIVDEFGDPMEGVVVDVRQILMVEGRPRADAQDVMAVALAAAPQTIGGRVVSIRGRQTDDRGRYRIFGLQPGKYVVQAVRRDRSATPSADLAMFYPGTPAIDQATQVNLGPEAEVAGIDLVLRPQRGYSIAGTVTGPDGRPARISIELARSERSGTIETQPVRQLTADGSFTFPDVAPGEYVVQATASGDIPTSRSGFVSAFVVVGNVDPAPVHLTLKAGTTLTGRVTYEGVQESPVNIPLTVRSVDRDRGPRSALTVPGFRPQSDGNFELGGLFGEASLIARSSGSDWYVKSILINGRDVLDRPFDFGVGRTIAGAEIVLSAGVAVATGRVTAERLAPVRTAEVVIFSANREKWVNGSQWLKAVRPVQDGTFRIRGMPPGDYLLAAIDRLDAGDTIGDPRLLDSLASRATRITLNQGQTQDVPLRLIRR